MYDSNNGNDGDVDLEYAVMFQGDEYDVFLNEEEAEDVAEDLRYDYPFADISVEPQELGESGYFDAEDASETVPEQEDLEGEDGDSGFVYPFLKRATMVEDFELNYHSTRWSLGDHTMRNNINFDEVISEAEDVNPQLAGLLQQAKQMVERVEVGGFECKVCGLNHRHSDQKHDIRGDADTTPGFSVTSSFADWMEFCPYCHCGVNELAMLMDFYGYIDAQIFRDESEFGAVRDLSNPAIQDICRRVREADPIMSFKDAVKRSPYSDLIGPEDYDGLEAFYRRWNDIKLTANRAPISAETRQDIEDLRDEAEEAVQA